MTANKAVNTKVVIGFIGEIISSSEILRKGERGEFSDLTALRLDGEVKLRKHGWRYHTESNVFLRTLTGPLAQASHSR